MGSLERFIGRLQSGLGRRKIRVGKATGDRSLEAEGQGEEESGDSKRSGKDGGELATDDVERRFPAS